MEISKKLEKDTYDLRKWIANYPSFLKRDTPKKKTDLNSNLLNSFLLKTPFQKCAYFKNRYLAILPHTQLHVNREKIK